MYKLRRIDIDQREKIYEELEEFTPSLRKQYEVKKVYLFGSFARGDINEASDIDLIILGEFEGKMPKRIEKVLDMTSLPIEPPIYTKSEFIEMKNRPFLKHILPTMKEL
jgi:predicted nucleotidyltransferase